MRVFKLLALATLPLLAAPVMAQDALKDLTVTGRLALGRPRHRQEIGHA